LISRDRSLAVTAVIWFSDSIMEAFDDALSAHHASGQ